MQYPIGIQRLNVFSFNLISRLDDPPRAPDELAGLTLSAFLGSDETPADSAVTEAGVSVTAPSVLIVDQFEEIFTTQPEQWEARVDFFRQLSAAQVAFPSLWVVLAMREDYIAQLDPVAAAPAAQSAAKPVLHAADGRIRRAGRP